MYIDGSALVASLAAPTENMQKVHVFPLLVEPSFNVIGLLVLEKKSFKGILLNMGIVAILVK